MLKIVLPEQTQQKEAAAKRQLWVEYREELCLVWGKTQSEKMEVSGAIPVSSV